MKTLKICQLILKTPRKTGMVWPPEFLALCWRHAMPFALLSAALLAGICFAKQEPRLGEPSTPGSTTTRSVDGVVTGPNGEPVAGAVVLLKDSKTLQVRSFITLKDGSYHFYGLSKDISYDLRAERGKESSGTKTVSSFNDHPKIKVNLKLKS
ncbi:MAG TPA: carboxypeptidase-like regulatory domain-containing protein [Bryobacteraceae bacterium]|jgi:hypothetical protein|nr:carboxypeptidase-like regulatory domain-containing protein [Bryobacteraceae bacterium]